MVSEVSIYQYLRPIKQSTIKDGLIVAFPDLAQVTLGIYYNPRSGRLLVRAYGAILPEGAQATLEQIVLPYRRDKPKIIPQDLRVTPRQKQIVSQMKRI